MSHSRKYIKLLVIHEIMNFNQNNFFRGSLLEIFECNRISHKTVIVISLPRKIE